MRILIAPDSFKGSLNSVGVAEAMAAGARRALLEAEIALLPLGDGGEGTLAALAVATGAETRTLTVRGPLGEPVQASYALFDAGQTAFVEMAEASGLSRVPLDRRDPLRATTYGTGELIAVALASGCKRLLIGIGGSATNDGGAGALVALGARFLDAAGRDLPPGGAALAHLHQIDLSHFRAPTDVEIVAACDVTNPLLGPEGASAIYGPQKGATAADIAALDTALARFADVAAAAVGRDERDTPGAGAAGGLGFGLLSFLGARLQRGIDLFLHAVEFDTRLSHADLVLSGEGRIDLQTVLYGKTLSALAALCRAAGVDFIAFAGGLNDDLAAVEDLDEQGYTALVPVTPRPMELAAAMAQAPALISAATERALRIYAAGLRRGDTTRFNGTGA